MTFRKGQSGNPGGRPKDDPELKAACMEFTPEAVKILKKWAKSDDPRASVTAIGIILDRGFGKPHQTSEVTINDARAEAYSDDQLAGVLAEREARALN